MASKNMLLYGSEQGLPEAVTLRAGNFEMRFEQGDLRAVRWQGVEIVRRMTVALRDRNWGTVENCLSNLRIEQQADSFRVTFEVVNRRAEIDFHWRGEIEAEADGRLRYRMDGVARSDFWRNRIGFCLLQPAGLAGTICRVERLDGTWLEGRLPLDIDPHQPVEPFTDMRGLVYPCGGAIVKLTFQGDAFEMEDQRNWTDASFKTFCTPLRYPYPVEVKSGDIVRQEIALHVAEAARGPETKRPSPGARAGSAVENADAVTVEVDWAGPAAPLPGIGFGMAGDGIALESKEIERLRGLHPHHLRVDIDPGADGWEERFLQAGRDAAALDTGLAVALFLPDEECGAALRRLRELRDASGARVRAWLAYARKENYSGGTPLERAIAQAREVFGGEPLGSGSNADLIFLKRNVPPLDHLGVVTFSLNPQVHAFDNLSLMETLEAQRMAVESARRLAGGLPVAVSAVTLKPRWNPYATAALAEPADAELPPQVDPRQLSHFGAAWTLGSVAALARGGVAWITYYETAGWRGLMERPWGCRLPQLFPSTPGELFPLFRVFAALADFQTGLATFPRISDPPRLAALGMEKEGRRALLLANLSPHVCEVRLAGAQAKSLRLGAYEFQVEECGA